MCGITGYLNFNRTAIGIDVLRRMSDSLKHRGPDDEGYVLLNMQKANCAMAGGNDTPSDVYSASYSFSPHQRLNDMDVAADVFNLAFGHRRLSIIDLSPSGHQPMCSLNGKRWIVYNGEIFNYIELREELKQRGHQFVTESDTEVILEAYDEWGYECLNRFNGMWAFALWDCDKRRLFCARDRFGIKPFYYYADSSVFIFASEIKAILQHPAVCRQVNDEVAYNYLMWGFLGYSADTFFKGIRQLDPGYYLSVDISGDTIIKRWWNLDINTEIGQVSNNDARKNAGKLASLLEDSIGLRLRSDVPIGTCLSGGLDSSSIVCLANRLMFNGHSVSPLIAGDRQKTFSACHEDMRIDERRFIEEVIQKTNAERNYVFPNGEKLWEDLPELVRHQDEPFAGTSIYAQWCVMKRVRERGVKVLLDGQGGDELLAGYQPYYGTFLLNLLLTGNVSQYLAEGVAIAGITGWYRMMASTGMSASVSAYNFLPVQLQMAASRLNSAMQGTHVYELISRDFVKKHFAGGAASFKDLTGDYGNLQKRLAKDVATELAVLLRYEDRNSMTFSVEARVPFLDYRLVEFAFSLPVSYKIHNGWTKWILREAMRDILPDQIRLRRDKLGFPTPNKQWLVENRENIIELFSRSACMSAGYIDASYIAGNINDLLRSDNSAAELWRFINFELWLRAFSNGN